MLTRADLHPYQNEAIQLIREHKRLAVWMPMGGGKSVSTLTALDDLSLTEDCFPALIIAPLRVARSTWPTEVESWSHISHLTISPIIGTAEQRQRALRRPADIHTINFDNLVWLLETLGDERPFKTIVVDEASRLASYRTRQGSVRMRALAKMAWDAERFIELTGSPGANGIKNLWGQSWFLDKGARLGSSFSAFTGRWFKLGYDGFTLEPMAHAQKEIQDKLKDVAFTIDLPPADLPIQNVIKVELPSKARELYKQLEKHFFMELATGEVEAANAAVKTMKLLQLSNGACFVDDEKHWELIHDAKLDVLDSIITEANGQPVLVAYQFTHDIDRIRKRFPQAKLLKTKADEDAWNRGEIEVALGHELSMGHGLSLQHGGNILVRFGLSWSLEGYEQIIERIGPRRQKQSGYDRPVFEHIILAADTMDEVVFERLTSKRSIQDILLEAMKVRAGLTPADRREGPPPRARLSPRYS